MTVESTTAAVESVVNLVAPVVAAAVPGVGTAVAGGLVAAESVANAVEANLPHQTAASDVAAGLKALAGTPIVQSNAVAAAKVSGIAVLFEDLLSFLGIE